MKRWTGKFLKKLKCHVQLLHHDLASRPKKIYFYDKYGCANKKEGKKTCLTQWTFYFYLNGNVSMTRDDECFDWCKNVNVLIHGKTMCPWCEFNGKNKKH